MKRPRRQRLREKLTLPNTNEHRRLERKEVDRHIAVKNALLDCDVGRIVNLHADGFMIIGHGEIRADCLYQFVMLLNEEIDGCARISVGAECLWLKETDSGTQYWAGFHIMDISDEDRAIISKITV